MKVLIFGGTHGNEWTGIYVVNKYQQYFKEKFPSLELDFIFSNPNAHEKKVRFVDEDLNRAFQFLEESRPKSYEHLRAKEIFETIHKETCFVIDLHTTTSNLGETVIVTQENNFNFTLLNELQEKRPQTKIILSPDPQRKYLVGQSNFGLMIEVGPVANNLLEAKSLESTLGILEDILQILSKSGPIKPSKLEVFEEIQDLYYPLDDTGERSGYIHPDFSGKDFCCLKGNFKIFKTFKGEDISISNKDEVFPIFINEAAYYPQNLAFTLCKKKIISFTSQPLKF